MYFSLTKKYKNSGIALVAVLAILVVLAIMAATFVTLMNIENKQSAVQMNSQQLDMLVDSGLEHAKSILTTDEIENALKDKPMLPDGIQTFSKWYSVKDKEGKICGRYRIKIEDEASKVNINKAYLLENSKGSGWDTGEINLPHALGVSKKTAKRLIDFKYGKNRLPGIRGDDDQNNLILMADGIDNNANGIIDENNEGIEDPREYTPQHLKGDDRKFSSMSELALLLENDSGEKSPNLFSKIMSQLPNRLTIFSIDKPGSHTLPNGIPSDINSITPRECRKLLIRANADTPFEPNASKQTQLAANIVDYRDENHVLSTLGSTYGVEAICFNEILANDESYTIATDKANNLNVDKPGYWKDSYGSEDDKRLIYHVDSLYDCVPDDPVAYPSIFGYYYNMDPRKAWRIKVVNRKVEMGNIKQLPDRKIILTFPKVIGKYGKGNPKFEPYFKATAPKDLPGSDPWCKWGFGNTVYSYYSATYEKYYKEVISIMKKLSSVDGNRPKLPKNYFKNSYVNVYAWSDDIRRYNPESIGCFKIRSGDQKSITIDNDNVYRKSVKFEEQLKKINMAFTNCDLSISINSWGNRSPVACVPEANTTYLIRAKRPISGKFFKILVGQFPEGHFGNKGYPDDLGVSGNMNGGHSVDENHFNKYWAYNDNKPIKTMRDGWMKIIINSSDKISRKASIRQWLSYFRVLAPEIVEMYNASATPISLANWRVICNTGSLATQIGRIRSTAYYDRKLRKRIIDDNPVVQPQGHFYLVNDTELFDSWYGNQDNKWGSSADEEIPVFQMDEQNWGVSYKIKSTRSVSGVGTFITLDESDLDKGTFRGETIKFIDKENENKPGSWNNIFAPVLFVDYNGNIISMAPNEIALDQIADASEFKKQVGKNIMVLGLLHGGGIVSLTLKNEYDQVCARTVDYGKVDLNEFNVSTEKIDPTKTTWIKRKKPSIGGTENKAKNRAMQSHNNDKFFIKNGPYCSVGEARNVSTGNDFERLGGSGNISKGANALGALSKHMCSSFIRLESCLGDVTRVGWEQAYDEVAKSSLTSVTGKKGEWKINKWSGSTLRFLTGPLRGEKYPIISNSKSTLNLARKNSRFIPRSAPNRKALKPNIGNKFSIGPGYKTPLCYTRKSGDSAVWTWRNVISYPGIYNFYVYGLNDAIDTTEFLEENNNASLDVELWNYKDNIYDMIKKRGKYGKQDSFNAGKIKPENISADGSIQMRLTAHNVTEINTDDKSGQAIAGTGGKQSGIAWFNYALITPVPVLGRVNINTAPACLLSSLPGINKSLAENIAEGVDVNGNKVLKPYQNLGDLFKVKGMNPDIFERCVNILTLDSSVYTVEIEAQTFKTSPNKPNVKQNNILSSRKKRFTIELNKRTDGFFDIIEKERYPVR